MTPMTEDMNATAAESGIGTQEPGPDAEAAGLDAPVGDDGAGQTTAARELKAIVESVLFVSQEPLSIQRLTAVIGDVSKAEVVQAIRSLGEELAQEGRGIRLAEVAGGYRLVTKQEYAAWVKRLDKSKSAAKLSRSALESLAIIAYKQPIVKSEIEEIRGVETSGVVRTLLERKLVRIVGRKEVPGRPIMYGTTKYFLEHFGLNDLSQLPPLREFKELGESEQAMLPIDEAEHLTANGSAHVTEVVDSDAVLDGNGAPSEAEDEPAEVDAEMVMEADESPSAESDAVFLDEAVEQA